MASALRTRAARTPGQFVDGWTNRITVAPELLPIWNSFCGFVAWPIDDHVPTAIDRWVRTHFWTETPRGIAILTDVFLEMYWHRRELQSKPESEDK